MTWISAGRPGAASTRWTFWTLEFQDSAPATTALLNSVAWLSSK
jgi:hypothetical protein